MTRYTARTMPGTTSVAHLEGEVVAHLPPHGYATKRAALAGWYRAVRNADKTRASLGLTCPNRGRPAVRELTPAA